MTTTAEPAEPDTTPLIDELLAGIEPDDTQARECAAAIIRASLAVSAATDEAAVRLGHLGQLGVLAGVVAANGPLAAEVIVTLSAVIAGLSSCIGEQQ